MMGTSPREVKPAAGQQRQQPDHSPAPQIEFPDAPPRFKGWIKSGNNHHWVLVAEGSDEASVWKATLSYPVLARVADRQVVREGQLPGRPGVQS